MSASQNQIDPTTHAADRAMAVEHGVSFSTNGMSPEDAALWAMPVDQLKSKILAEAGARDDFNKMQSELQYMEATAAAANANPTNTNLKAAITAGLRAEKADQVARQSAARIGMQDAEFNLALRQLDAFDPRAATPATDANAPQQPADASRPPYEVRKGADGSYSVQLDTNEIFQGANADELIAKLAKAKHETGRWGRDLHAELKRLKSGQSSPPNGQQQPNLNDPSAFNINAPQNQAPLNSDIAEAFAKSVGFSDAAEMISDYQRTQAQLQDMQSKLQAANEFASKYEDEQLAETFMMTCPEFPGDPTAMEALTKVMDASDLDWTKVENLQLAHQHCIRQGFYRPLTQDDIQAGIRGNGEPQGRSAPPRPPQGSAPGNADPTNPWAMSTDELRKKVLEGGGLGKALLEMTSGSALGGQ
jgi:hypothetical protein